MAVKLNVRNVDLRGAQETLDNNVRQVREAGRKAVLAYAGLWGMAYDEAVAVLDRSRKVLEEAESRGEKLEAEANRRVKNVRKEAESRVKTVEARVESLRDKAMRQVERSEEKVEYDVEDQVQRVLDRLGIPSRERIVRLSLEIEALSKKIDAQLTTGSTQSKDNAVVVEVDDEPTALPVVDYDTLTAKEIVALLDGLTIAELAEVKRYEEAHENRVTVLREVDRRIEAMPIAGYDTLTVEEVETKLGSLDADQLAYVARYEAAHENRVTLLRSIEREREERQPMAA